MAQRVKGLAAKADDQLKSWDCAQTWKETASSVKLSSDLPMQSVVGVRTHTHK